jgi:hypothetical protein
MVVRKKNLLDAFQASAPEGRVAARRGNDVRSSAAGPFAPVRESEAALCSTSSERSSATIPQPMPQRIPLWRRSLGDRAVRIAIVAGLLCIGAAYWIGRRQAPAVEAHETPADISVPGALMRTGAEPPAPVSDTDLARRNQAMAQAGSAHDQQFMNPANKYTVRVKTFANDASGCAAARALHGYFVRENLPVILPIQQGKSCVLYVGHDAKKKDADQLASYIQRMHVPSDAKKAAFEDAYVVNIDDVVKR